MSKKKQLENDSIRITKWDADDYDGECGDLADYFAVMESANNGPAANAGEGPLSGGDIFANDDEQSLGLSEENLVSARADEVSNDDDEDKLNNSTKIYRSIVKNDISEPEEVDDEYEDDYLEISGKSSLGIYSRTNPNEDIVECRTASDDNDIDSDDDLDQTESAAAKESNEYNAESEDNPELAGFNFGDYVMSLANEIDGISPDALGVLKGTVNFLQSGQQAHRFDHDSEGMILPMEQGEGYNNVALFGQNDKILTAIFFAYFHKFKI